MGLGQPLAGAGLAHPDCRGVVVVVFALGVVAGAAVECVDDVVGGEGGVRREDANLKIAEFVGLELAVLQIDQESVDGLDVVIHFDEIFGEEAANRGEVAFGHGGPEMLLEVDDFDGGGERAGSLSKRRQGKCDGESQKEEEGTHKDYVSVWPRPSWGWRELVGGGFGPYFADGGVDDGVEELAMIGAGLGLDVFAGALAGFGVVGKREAASLGGDCGELLDDVEEGGFISAGELPAVGDGAGEDLLGGPVVWGGGVG